MNLSWLGQHYNLVVVLVGLSLLGAASGAIGCFAVLRRRALMGDALAHAALPGVCLGYLAVGERNLPAMLLGALISGVVGSAVIAALARWTRIKEDAAIGIVLTVFFGAGIVLMSIIMRSPQETPAGLDHFIFGSASALRRVDLPWIAGLALVTLTLVLGLYKEFKLIAFDADFAGVQGWPTLRLDFVLLTMIVLTVVVGLPAVGALLMAALLVLPAAAARFWTDRLGVMLTLSALFGLTASMTGVFIPLPTGPTVILAGSLIFVFSMTMAPRRGLLAHWLARRRQRRDFERRQLLATIYDLLEPSLPQRLALAVDDLTKHRAWPARRIESALRRLQRDEKLVLREGNTVTLTDAGLAQAEAVARNLRRWRLFLLEQPELAGSLLQTDWPDLETILTLEQLQGIRAGQPSARPTSRASEEAGS